LSRELGIDREKEGQKEPGQVAQLAKRRWSMASSGSGIALSASTANNFGVKIML